MRVRPKDAELIHRRGDAAYWKAPTKMVDVRSAKCLSGTLSYRTIWAVPSAFSRKAPSCGNRPQRLDALTPKTDDPIIPINGGITMSRYKP